MSTNETPTSVDEVRPYATRDEAIEAVLRMITKHTAADAAAAIVDGPLRFMAKEAQAYALRHVADELKARVEKLTERQVMSAEDELTYLRRRATQHLPSGMMCGFLP